MLVVDSQGSAGVSLTLRRSRWWTRLAARVLAPGLDRRLAEGRPPESNILLAARAQALVSPCARQRHADLWENLAVRTTRPAGMRSPGAPLNRRAIGACASRMAEVRDGLTATGPISARGLAMVSRLLSDGTGPLYDRRLEAPQLDMVLGEVVAALQPSLLGQGFTEYATS